LEEEKQQDNELLNSFIQLASQQE